MLGIMTSPSESELRARFEASSSTELRSLLGPVRSPGMTELALAVIRSILAERAAGKAAEPSEKRCPSCSEPLVLEAGELVTKTTWPAFLLVGFGYQPTWFVSHEDGERTVVIRPYLARSAARCRSCGLVMFDPSG